MADQPTTPSGSRWEPTDDAGTDDASTDDAPAYDPDDVLPPPPLADAAVDPAVDPEAAQRRTQLRGRAILAGAATALTLGGGLTGFVIGHSTAGDGNDGFRPAGFSGPPGTGRFDDQGPQGQQGPPSFRGPGAGSDDSGSDDDAT
ncbi:MAG: hypothetical protein JF565_04515 [Propionibacteriales bacterium]|nr:hypothetical protein [Propionibacteriales bacterium]